MTFEFEASNFGETQGYVAQLGTATICLPIRTKTGVGYFAKSMSSCQPRSANN